MPRFVQREVKERSEDPSPRDEIVLLVGHARNSSTSIEELVLEADGDVLESLPFRAMRVSVPETALEKIIDHPDVETVELDSGMETLQGN